MKSNLIDKALKLLDIQEKIMQILRPPLKINETINATIHLMYIG